MVHWVIAVALPLRLTQMSFVITDGRKLWSAKVGLLLNSIMFICTKFHKNQNYIQHLVWRERRDLWPWKYRTYLILTEYGTQGNKHVIKRIMCGQHTYALYQNTTELQHLPHNYNVQYLSNQWQYMQNKAKITVYNSQHKMYLIFQHTNKKNKWMDNSAAYILQGVSETVFKQML